MIFSTKIKRKSGEEVTDGTDISILNPRLWIIKMKINVYHFHKTDMTVTLQKTFNMKGSKNVTWKQTWKLNARLQILLNTHLVRWPVKAVSRLLIHIKSYDLLVYIKYQFCDPRTNFVKYELCLWYDTNLACQSV